MTATYADFRFIRTEPGARIVNAVLALTILVSPIVFVEPSPYEGMVFVLAVVAFAFGVPITRRMLPLLVLFAVWAFSGLLALMPAIGDGEAVKYYAISVYMMIAAGLFACLVAEDTIGRVATLSNAYIVAAIGVSLIAIAAYFGAIPAAKSFLHSGRATGTFKDPNVFGPYLILPLLLLIHRIFDRGVRFSYVAALLVLLFALFLSFSRAAWGHFVFSAFVMVALLILINGRGRFRRRLIVITAAVVIGVLVLLSVALSISSVREMFTIRAELLQSYDSGDPSGRFGRQKEAIGVVIEQPNGLGPKQFARQYGQDIHNVYLNAFVTYGWGGGLAYLAIVLLTLKLGFGAILRASPWRSYLVAAYASFVGVAGEGMVIDTDHWRHFFLLVGLIWGLSAATSKYRRPLSSQSPMRAQPGQLETQQANGGNALAAAPARRSASAEMRLKLASE